MVGVTENMFFEPERFKVVFQTHGSGWQGVHVALDKYTMSDDGTPILSRDALTKKEFDLHIDELIAALELTRKKGHKALAKLKKQKAK